MRSRVTLLNGLLARDSAVAALPRAGIVHRLDKDTSGLMVVGKTLAAVTALSRAIAAREVRRQYLALAHGAWPPGLTQVDAPVGRDPRSRVRMAVLASGRAARTDIERIAFAAEVDGGVSALRCTLHTGRTHQIRFILEALAQARAASLNDITAELLRKALGESGGADKASPATAATEPVAAKSASPKAEGTARAATGKEPAARAPTAKAPTATAPAAKAPAKPVAKKTPK